MVSLHTGANGSATDATEGPAAHATPSRFHAPISAICQTPTANRSSFHEDGGRLQIDECVGYRSSRASGCRLPLCQSTKPKAAIGLLGSCACWCQAPSCLILVPVHIHSSSGTDHDRLRWGLTGRDTPLRVLKCPRTSCARRGDTDTGLSSNRPADSSPPPHRGRSDKR